MRPRVPCKRCLRAPALIQYSCAECCSRHAVRPCQKIRLHSICSSMNSMCARRIFIPPNYVCKVHASGIMHCARPPALRTMPPWHMTLPLHSWLPLLQYPSLFVRACVRVSRAIFNKSHTAGARSGWRCTRAARAAYKHV